MTRRELMLLLGGAVTAPRALRAQQKAISVIGFLSSRSQFESEPLVAAFRRGLNEAGFAEGRNTAIEYHWAENRYDRLPGLAARLVSRHVAVIVAQVVFLQPSPPRLRLRQYQSCSHQSAIPSNSGWLPA